MTNWPSTSGLVYSDHAPELPYEQAPYPTDPRREPKFAVGALVQHKASKKFGIIIRACMKCTNNDHPFNLWWHDITEHCLPAFTGQYIVSTDFDKNECKVAEEALTR